MQVGLTGSLPSFALTSADEAKSAAAARPPDSNSITLPALEEVETAQGSGTDERTEDDARRRQQQKAVADNSETETAQAEQQAQKRVEQRRAKELEQAEAAEIQALDKRDREVRAHEQAHQSVGGAYSSGASYTFITGPNGVRYAISGEVSIDMSKVPDNPQATLQKASVVQKAALAPADPSSQDRQIAAQAVRLALEARSQIQQQSLESDAQKSTSDRDEVGDSVGVDANDRSLNLNQARSEAAQSGDEEEATTPLAEATARLIELNEDLSRIYEKLIEAQNFEQVSSISQLLDIDT